MFRDRADPSRDLLARALIAHRGSMSTVEHALIFAKAGADRLAFAERLVLALPELSRGALVDCDLAWRASSRFLAVVARFLQEGYTTALRDRLAYWAARSGGRAAALLAMAPADVQAFHSHLESCDLKVKGIVPANLFDAAGRLVTEAGAATGRRRSLREELILAVDVNGPGWEGVTFQPDVDVLFLAGPMAPPVGDELSLSFRIPSNPRPVAARGIVLEVRRPEDAGPGLPAGFSVGLWDVPPAVRGALAAHAPASVESSRCAPRFQMRAPVKVVLATPAAKTPPARALAPPPLPSPRALIEYASDQELAADYVENLSHGGAFVRTAQPAPAGSTVALELRLPNGAELRSEARVVFVREGGMGVQFALDAEAEAALSAAIAHISARPRRALVVDDDELARRMLSDALAVRGFEVLTAEDAGAGLQTLSDELLALDLLLTDLVMPGMDGEVFVRTIRQIGGESELAIVAVTGQLAGDMEARLEAAGADAVLEKVLGPELIAQAADAALERKRITA